MGKRPDGEARRGRISLVDLRLRSNEARGPLARKPSRLRSSYGGQAGRQVFWPQPLLARHAKPASGILAPVRKHPRRLGCGQTLATDCRCACHRNLDTFRLSVRSNRNNHARVYCFKDCKNAFSVVILLCCKANCLIWQKMKDILSPKMNRATEALWLFGRIGSRLIRM